MICQNVGNLKFDLLTGRLTTSEGLLLLGDVGGDGRVVVVGSQNTIGSVTRHHVVDYLETKKTIIRESLHQYLSYSDEN